MSIPDRVLMLILPWTPETDAERAFWVAEEAIRGGVNWLLLRVRNMPARMALDPAMELRRLTRRYSVLFSVNPYPALVEWVSADALHLPETELDNPHPPQPSLSMDSLHPPQPSLSHWEREGVELPSPSGRGVGGEGFSPPPRLLGYSVHSVASAKQAVQAGADYLLVGTMFPTPSHPDKTPEGIELLKAVAKAVSVPLIAIGGITPERVGLCLRAGARGVAVISGILESESPYVSAQGYWQSLQAV